MRVELVYFAGCPNVDGVRRRLRSCMERCSIDAEIVEIDTNAPGAPDRYRRFGSPTVLIDGRDVLGGAPGESACRLDLPTDSQLVAALGGDPD